MAVERFSKDSKYFFLSNMCPVKPWIVTKDGIEVSTAEHAYVAAKFTLLSDRMIVYDAKDGYKAKSTAQRLFETGRPVWSSWDDIKVDVMKDVINRKFVVGSRLASLLLKTGNEELIEGNTWGDTFWGVSPPRSGNGQNWLGRILMDRRSELHKGKS